MADHFWFNGWEPLMRILIVGSVSYVVLLVFLRSTGKRSLSKMNGYDFIITMAIGSILAKIILSPEISLSESLVAMALLIGLQLLASWASVRFRWVHRLLSSPPSIVYHNGTYEENMLRRERLSHHDIHEAVHECGLKDLSLVDMVIFASNGQLQVIKKRSP